MKAARKDAGAAAPERFAPGLAAFLRPIDGLREDPANVRRHPAANLAAIRASLEQFGQQKPIVMGPSGATVAGAGTLAAARSLGWTRIAAVTTDLEGRAAQAFAVADNRTAELASWDDEALGALLKELAAKDAALLAATGFADADLAALLREPGGTAVGALAQAFIFPPFSVLDARSGPWQERKRAWLALGIQSEMGRAGAPPGGSTLPAATLGADGKTRRGDGAGRALVGTTTWTAAGRSDPVSRRIIAASARGASCSIFDPVLCELIYRWFAPPAGRVLDPLAGGSVRGIVASRLRRAYAGVELRAEQVAANRAQLAIAGDPAPVWIEGDARDVRKLVGDRGPFDLIFSCPPYADLERYSDDPRDLSTLDYPAFLASYRSIIADAVALLAPDRFAAFVVGDVRDPRSGAYRGFPADTIGAFKDAGAALYNEAVLVPMVGSLSLRAGRAFAVSRKLGKAHQNVLIFVKGDPKRATAACGPVEIAHGDPLSADEGEITDAADAAGDMQ